MDNFIEIVKENWWLFTWASLIISLISLFFMADASRYFMYDKWTSRKFSIMDIEFPSSARYYAFIMTRVVSSDNKIPLVALRKSLYFDFFFMTGIYPFIALLAFHASTLHLFYTRLFYVIVLLQLIAWILDIIENIIILVTTYKPKLFIKKLSEDLNMHEKEEVETGWYGVFNWTVRIKWVFAIIGFFITVMYILYILIFTELYDQQSNSVWKGLFMVCVIIAALMITRAINAKPIIHKNDHSDY